MCKTIIKNDLETFESEIKDLIMLEDSTHGTLCAIHKTINAAGNFPHSKHQLLRLCPVSKCNSRIPLRSRRTSRSRSPNLQRKMLKVPVPKNVCRRSSSFAPYICTNAGHSEARSMLNVEKTISCPGKMSCNNPASNCSTNSFHIDYQLAHSLIGTDEVVSELKDEIELIKHQLKHKPDPNKQVAKACDETKLKHENKRLKRELETKKKLLEASRKDVDKARDILSDYERKVSLLHEQAIKSSKAMKACKERFCKCLKEKEEQIKCLKGDKDSLVAAMEERERECGKKNEELEKMKTTLDETNEKCSVLKETNKNFCECIEMLREQLDKSSNESEQYKAAVKNLEQKVCDLNCACKKIVSKTKKQKDRYEQELKSHEETEKSLSRQISMLSARLIDVDGQKTIHEQLKTQCEEMRDRLKEYERYAERCQCLEEECKRHYEKLTENEKKFEKERGEMQKLVEELTTVVDSNKVSLLQMSEINKQQQMLIKTQSVALMSKAEQLNLIEKQSENFKRKTEELEREVEELRKSLSEPCSKEACLCVSKELQEVRETLSLERDNHLLKAKIIEDQSQTIVTLQHQVKDRIYELERAQSDTKYLEEELMKINEKLLQKHDELDRQMDEKDNLLEKVKDLENQKEQLAQEVNEFEEMFVQFKDNYANDEKKDEILTKLKSQIEEQRKEWKYQKELLAKEKQKAVFAARFATKKLLETVADFQRQVDAQRRVQILLTKMLHDKDEQLKIVSSKISDISAITSGVYKEDLEPIKELYRRNVVSSNPTTTTSFYSSCSSCCKGQGKRVLSTTPCANINQLFHSLNVGGENLNEEPIRDA